MQIIYTNEVLISEQCCGNILPNYFSVNIHSFTESKVANSCLNKKIAVDRLGNIKNCPSMKFSFGNINKTTLLECIENERFKDLWSVNKDQVLVCKDCEFRYICHDCRAYTQNEEKYSKPLKCKYNPYEAIWE
jgi:SPASM domain peptide maturase of grasp-with-spasm system